jgi:hypothetical protein
MNCVKRVSFDDDLTVAEADVVDSSEKQDIPYDMYFGCERNKEKTLRAYAVARYRAIQLANGEGRMFKDETRTFEEESPGGWSGAKTHKNENRDRPLVWVEDRALLFFPSDAIAMYGRESFQANDDGEYLGIRCVSVKRREMLECNQSTTDQFEHIGENPFISGYDPIFVSIPRTLGNHAASAKARQRADILWLVDTGCGHDLVSHEIAKLCKCKFISLENPITFQTANGDAPSTHSAAIRFGELDETIEPYVLNETPSVISVGNRTMNQGYSFVWNAGENPYFITPRGKVIGLEVIDDIPYIRRDSAFCQPRDVCAKDYVLKALPSAPSGSKVIDEVQQAVCDLFGMPYDGEPPPIPQVGENPEEERKIRNLRDEAQSIQHLLTHKPANKYCDACNLGKMRNVKLFAGSFNKSRNPTEWLDIVTADHLVAKNGSMEGLTGDCNALVIKDLYSKIKVLMPVFGKSSDETIAALQYFVGTGRIKLFYSDNAPELVRVCKTLQILQEHSTPGRPQNNSIIERTNLDILEGTRTTLISAGFPECFWPFAAPHFCFLDNTSTIGADGKVYEEGSSYFRAHGEETNVLRLPFGCEVIFLPSPTKGLPHSKWEGVGEVGVIAGYHMKPGYLWSGEYYCWSLKELVGVDMRQKAENTLEGSETRI